MSKRAAILLGAGVAIALPALAHHSFAMFDHTKVVALKGTVKEFQWTNPHVVLWVYTEPLADGAGGAPQVWSLELTSPGNLTRTGWNRKSLKAGDKVELQLNPLRDGTHGGSFLQARILDTGQVLAQPDFAAQERPGLQ